MSIISADMGARKRFISQPLIHTIMLKIPFRLFALSLCITFVAAGCVKASSLSEGSGGPLATSSPVASDAAPAQTPSTGWARYSGLGLNLQYPTAWNVAEHSSSNTEILRLAARDFSAYITFFHWKTATATPDSCGNLEECAKRIRHSVQFTTLGGIPAVQGTLVDVSQANPSSTLPVVIDIVYVVNGPNSGYMITYAPVNTPSAPTVSSILASITFCQSKATDCK
jgi:hypothetical protein